jgi:hypothetical protein
LVPRFFRAFAATAANLNRFSSAFQVHRLARVIALRDAQVQQVRPWRTSLERRGREPRRSMSTKPTAPILDHSTTTASRVCAERNESRSRCAQAATHRCYTTREREHSGGADEIATREPHVASRARTTHTVGVMPRRQPRWILATRPALSRLYLPISSCALRAFTSRAVKTFTLAKCPIFRDASRTDSDEPADLCRAGWLPFTCKGHDARARVALDS